MYVICVWLLRRNKKLWIVIPDNGGGYAVINSVCPSITKITQDVVYGLCWNFLRRDYEKIYQVIRFCVSLYAQELANLGPSIVHVGRRRETKIRIKIHHCQGLRTFLVGQLILLTLSPYITVLRVAFQLSTAFLYRPTSLLFAIKSFSCVSQTIINHNHKSLLT